MPFPPSVAVPNVLGLESSASGRRVVGHRLPPGGQAEWGLPAGPPGVVVGQSPPAGFQAPRKSRVSISATQAVYSGTPQSPAHVLINPATGAIVVHVPNVVGLNQSQAVAALAIGLGRQRVELR